MKNFKIVEETYHDGLGIAYKSSFYIKELKNLLGIPYWRYIKKTEDGGMGGSYKREIQFESINAAETFITTILCPKVPRETTINKDIKTIVCL